MWSSQDLVETLPACFVSSFELLGTETAQVAVTSGRIVERVDAIRDVRNRQLPVLVDLG